MESATPEGLRALSGIIEYCQENDANIKSDRAFARYIRENSSGNNSTEGNAQSIGRMKKAWESPGSQKFTQPTLYIIAPYLWIPGSEFRDRLTGQELSRLMFSGEELRGICEGDVHLCTLTEMRTILNGDSLKGISPFTTAIEERRRDRRHTYRDLCEACLLPPVDATRIRRLLAFNGWAPNPVTITRDLIALARYMADVLPGMSADEQSLQREKALNHLARLQAQSVHKRELNGASA